MTDEEYAENATILVLELLKMCRTTHDILNTIVGLNVALSAGLAFTYEECETIEESAKVILDDIFKNSINELDVVIDSKCLGRLSLEQVFNNHDILKQAKQGGVH